MQSFNVLDLDDTDGADLHSHLKLMWNTLRDKVKTNWFLYKSITGNQSPQVTDYQRQYSIYSACAVFYLLVVCMGWVNDPQYSSLCFLCVISAIMLEFAVCLSLPVKMGRHCPAELPGGRTSGGGGASWDDA